MKNIAAIVGMGVALYIFVAMFASCAQVKPPVRQGYKGHNSLSTDWDGMP